MGTGDRARSLRQSSPMPSGQSISPSIRKPAVAARAIGIWMGWPAATAVTVAPPTSMMTGISSTGPPVSVRAEAKPTSPPIVT